jgi:hypothetical protein
VIPEETLPPLSLSLLFITAESSYSPDPPLICPAFGSCERVADNLRSYHLPQGRYQHHRTTSQNILTQMGQRFFRYQFHYHLTSRKRLMIAFISFNRSAISSADKTSSLG